MDKKICSECGTENESDYIYCKNCGTLLAAPAKPAAEPQVQQTAEKASEHEFITQAAELQNKPPVQPVYGTGNSGYMPDSNPITDGIPQEELALFIGKKSAVIMPKFIKMEITNSKVSWCWPAAVLGFLFGPMGAALWFFYRKMYKTGALLAVIGAVVNIIVAALTFNTASVDYTLLYRSILSGDLQSVLNAFSSIGNTSTLLDVIGNVISSAADLVTCILTGLYGYYLYKEHCIKTINNFRMSISDRRYYTMGLASIGGVSGGMLAVGIICIIVVSNLITAVTAVVSML